MTLQEFADVFGALAVQLRQTDADSVTIRAYFEPMKDLEIEFVRFAAERLAATAEWFPKTSEWREAAKRIESERVMQLRDLLRRRVEPLCLACADTTWQVGEDGARRCECSHLRRLEVLGRRPMPALPAACETRESVRIPVDVEAVAATLASAKGWPVKVKTPELRLVGDEG